MEIIPVLDVAGGLAVHAVAGGRGHYQPVRSELVLREGDAVALLRAFHDTLGVRECYTADLDAIQGGTCQRDCLRQLGQVSAACGGKLLVDAGIHNGEEARALLSLGIDQVIVGLETLPSFSDLASILQTIGASRTIFSLDLRHGALMLHPAMREQLGARAETLSLATHAAHAGVTTVLVVDIGRVGTGLGVDLDLVQAIRQSCPGTRLLAGGGVRTRHDLDQLLEVGCDGALVASAIHTGAITAADLAELRAAGSGRSQSGTSASR